jgi:lysyl-tRNA synthetase class 2
MSDLRQQRLAKLKQLADPYPQPDLSTRDTCLEALAKLDQKVTVAGRLMSLRGHGKIVFADLHDRTGKIQLFFEQQPATKLFDIGDIISASGLVFTTQAGEPTIRVNQLQLLAKNLRPLPEKWHGLTDTEERYRQRYVDLIVNPKSREVFLTRTKILTAIRKYLDDHGFLEVETPILQPIYGGASAKPFVTYHHELNQDMYLRISNELYLKRLIVGGLEKVYEVSKDFRNESVSRFHHPEFTQVEFYWAYVDYDVLMRFTEELITYVVQKVKGSLQVTFQNQTLDFTPPFKRLTFRDAILEKTKIDIDQIKTIKDFLKNLETAKLKIETEGLIGLGAHFDALYKEHVRPNLAGPVYITDYPAEMIALAKRKADNPQKIASFQLLAAGTELLKAYNELNDPKDQYDRWLEEGKLAQEGLETAMQMDDDYIRALEYGMPPTAGWGMGVDRFTQFLTDTPTIKDTILFPSLRSSQTSIISRPVVIGKVVEINPHPNSVKLYLVKVTDGKTNYDVICACCNYQIGDLVAFAPPGAVVPTPDGKTQVISKIKIRQVESNGMLCSPLELGVSSDQACIYILPSDLKPHLGEPVAKFLHADS